MSFKFSLVYLYLYHAHMRATLGAAPAQHQTDAGAGQQPAEARQVAVNVRLDAVPLGWKLLSCSHGQELTNERVPATDWSFTLV